MIVYKDLIQGSDEWHSMRRGKVTGSKLSSVLGTSLTRTQLIAELIGEYASEQTKTFKPTIEMERGTEQEPLAVQAFEKLNNVEINRNVGFMISDEFNFLGFSPDGILEDSDFSEMIEIKNPDTKTMMFYKIANMIPQEETKLSAGKQNWCGISQDYKYQVLCGFLVNEKCKKIHFLVHDARIIDEKQRLYTVTIERDNELVQKELKEVREELIRFRADWLKWQDIIMPSNF